MSTTRIKEKVSQLVNSQLPEFIRSDYTTFVAFLEYYYQFLEQDQNALELVQNARQYSDIDKTADSFVNYFLNNYAKDLPQSLQVDKGLLIKRIKGLYAAKGGSLSIETLFRILYDTAALTRYPYDSVLRPSNGKWNQRNSLRVLRTSGSVSDIKDRFITFTKDRVKYTAEVLRVKILDTNLFEIFFHAPYPVPFGVNDTITISDNTNVIFTGVLQPTLTTTRIISGGSNFKAGQVFTLSIAGGLNTLVRITKVSSTGAIERLKILSYGFGFNESISINLSNSGGVSSRTKYLDTKTGGFSETFTILRPHTTLNADRYFDTDYVTPFNFTGDDLVEQNISSQLTNSVTTTGIENPNDAVLSFGTGAIARYPGEYTSTQGFLSEPDNRLQDDELYQPFAYQVVSELDISVFYDIVKKLIHQAGTNLFVDRVLSATADISGIISVQSRKNVNSELNSVFTTLDTVAKLIRKVADNDNVVTSAEITSYTLLKPLIDETTISDQVFISVFKSITDDVQSTDSNTFFTFNKVETDNAVVSDLTETGPQDYTTPNVTLASYFLEEYSSNTLAAATTISLSKVEADSVNATDIITEPGPPDYAEGYFLETYSEFTDVPIGTAFAIS
jgi:hypothetical protein